MLTTAERRAIAVKDVLDSHEQQLYLRHKAGKSLRALSQIYRQYEGENGVQEKINEIHGRVESAVRARTPGASAANVVRNQMAEDEDDGFGGLPIRDARSPSRRPARPPRRTSDGGGLNVAARGELARSQNGAGAAGESPAATPPIQPAPAQSSPELDAPAASPSRAPRAAGEPRQSGFATDEVLEALERGTMIASEIEARIPASNASVRRALRLLEADGRIIDTRFRRTGPLGGKASKVWGLPGSAMTPEEPVPAAKTYPLADMPGAPAAPEGPITRAELLALLAAARAECERSFKRLESLLKIG